MTRMIKPGIQLLQEFLDSRKDKRREKKMLQDLLDIAKRNNNLMERAIEMTRYAKDHPEMDELEVHNMSVRLWEMTQDLQDNIAELSKLTK